MISLSAVSVRFYKLIKHLGHEEPNAGEVNAERGYDASHTAHHAATSHGLRPENMRSIKTVYDVTGVTDWGRR